MSSEIVITGMSGRFPESDSIEELSRNLYNKVDMVTENDRRWVPGLHGLPRRSGNLKDISKFDSQFFGVHHKQAYHLDPQARMLLESSYETIVDAGYAPEELHGRNIGVYIGCSSSETDEFLCRNPKIVKGYGIIGCCRGMFANRISFTFDFKGPSYTIDTACSSAALALCEAVRAIQSGVCDAAIVGGANLCLRPATALQFDHLNMLSSVGSCKSFDADADGYGRSEAIVTLFLQKSDMARRKYATIVHIKTNTDGYKDQGVTFPSAAMQKRLIQEVYEECKLDPLQVSYVEAHGTGTPAGDPIEMSAISDIFCEGRQEPLLVGAVKTNMGHPEPASGLCSVVKVLISMERGLIPPNLHYNSPNPEIPSLVEGRVKIVTEETPWEGGYAALSCFGFGGVNVHAVIKSNEDVGNTATKRSSIPQLVLYGGRTEEGLQHLFDHVSADANPREFFALLHKSAFATGQAKPFRGYKLMVEAEGKVEAIKKLSSDQRPLWYIFSGMGTQWPGMGRQLMGLDVFAASIHRSAKVLKPYGLDLIDLVTKGVKDTSNARSIIPAFTSIAAVQVALVDVLHELGMVPDGLIGHSVGELGCAYADGSFTAEQMVLAAYWRGKAVEEAKLEHGAMAALGLTWSEAQGSCPKDIFPSCHNAEDSVTVSGPVQSVKDLVAKLKADNVFAREVDSCGYAFHSQYIYPAAGRLQEALEKVVPTNKPRSSRWVSSSYKESEWDDPSAKLSGASYFVHNLVSPVLFHEALRHVPKDAVVVEVAPHHLLQAILKRVIGPDAEYIGLMKRNVDNTVHLLSSIGRLFTSGLNPDIERLYPGVSFPVSRSTPNISSLIKWDHSASWLVANFDQTTKQSQMITEVNVGPEDSPDHYILGHTIDGRCLYPATAYLLLVWNALADIKGKEMAVLPVNFEDVKIHRATVMSQTATTKFLVDISPTEGEFEISEGGMTVCTGKIYTPEETTVRGHFKSKDGTTSLELCADDIYKELRLRGYDYGPTFQGVKSSDIGGNRGLLRWDGNWVAYLDAMLQFCILGSHKRALRLPTRIQSMQIDPLKHTSMVEGTLQQLEGIPIFHDKNTHQCFSGGVIFKNLKASIAPRHQGKQVPLLEEYHFVPYNETCTLSKTKQDTLERYVHVCSSVAKRILELSGKNKDQIWDVMNGFKEADDALIASYIKSCTDDHVLLKSLCGILDTATGKDLTMHVKNSVDSYLTEMDRDILSQTLVGEFPLRTVLDLVLENATSRKLKIAEVSDSPIPLSFKVNQMLQTLNMFNVSYTIAHSKQDVLDKDSLVGGKFEVSQWDNKGTLNLKDVDLFVVKYSGSQQDEYRSILMKATEAVKEEAFLAVIQRTRLVPAESFMSAVSKTVIPFQSEATLEKTFKELNLTVVCKKNDSVASTLYLLRKNSGKSYEEDIISVGDDMCAWVDQLREKVVEVSEDSSGSKRVWLVSEGNVNSGIVGLVNCLRQEPGGSSIRCVFTSKKSPKFNLKNPFYQDLATKNLAMNICKRGTWGSYRHVKMSEAPNRVDTEHAYLNVLTRGDLSSLVWVDSPLKYFSPATTRGSLLCHVYYAPLNFRDIMLASGKLPPDAIPGDLALQDCILGLEFSGRLQNGKRVMGLVPSKGLATTVTADSNFMWDVPVHWSLEEASTVPVAYSTAYYALVIRGHLQKGEKVLIHSGSGGVGQAAIAIALGLKCEVYTSVGTNEKREFLKKRFPALTDRNFCNSRDVSFEEYVLQATNGEGVDVIVNSLADEKLKATLNCLAQHGRFLEIGKYDLSNNSPLGMAIFLKNIAFHGILLDALFEGKSSSACAKKDVVRLVKEGIEDGTVQPLNSVLFNHDQAEQAFRFMASGRHIGKVVLKVKEEEPEKIVIPEPVLFNAITRTTCDPDKSYLIIGGLGGFGLELCQWLVERGARHIVLSSRSGVTSGYQQLCVDRWQKESANVVVSTLNAAKQAEAQELLELTASLGPVAGIFNLALVLRDAFMENQTPEMYREVCESKISSTAHLDTLSRTLCAQLRWFVCFSSVSCGRGNAGQSNYGFANSAMERMCEERRAEGLPGLAIQWGAIGDVGVIQDTVGTDVVIGGTVPQRIVSCLSVLDKFMQQGHPVVSSLVPYQPSESTTQKDSKHNVLSTVGNIFGIKDMSSINPETSLGELGMDSLMGVEVKQFLERDLDLVLTIPELRHLKVKDLKNLEGRSDGSTSADADTTEEISGSEEVPGYFSSLTSDQLVPTETTVRLNSAKKGIPLIVIHPIEGTAVMFEQLSQLLPFPVYGIQCTKEAPSGTIESLASWYWKHIQSLKVGKTVHLAGYSFGASVAFEMASQAERDPRIHPLVHSLVFLDGSPALVTSYTREHESHFIQDSQVEGEAEALISFVMQFVNITMSELKAELLSLRSFAERVKLACGKINASYPWLKADDLSSAFDLYYKKLVLSLQYTPKYRLKRPLTLIKASDSLDIMKTFSDLYDLEKVCEGKITVHTVEGTHKTFIQDKGAKDISNLLKETLSN